MPRPSEYQMRAVAGTLTGDSIYRGQTWAAYAPGRDEKHPRNYVSRDQNGNLHACVNSRKELIEHAKTLKVKLRWAKR